MEQLLVSPRSSLHQRQLTSRTQPPVKGLDCESRLWPSKHKYPTRHVLGAVRRLHTQSESSSDGYILELFWYRANAEALFRKRHAGAVAESLKLVSTNFAMSLTCRHEQGRSYAELYLLFFKLSFRMSACGCDVARDTANSSDHLVYLVLAELE